MVGGQYLRYLGIFGLGGGPIWKKVRRCFGGPVTKCSLLKIAEGFKTILSTSLLVVHSYTGIFQCLILDRAF